MTDAITAILTVWKRNHLEEQIQALLKQTVRPHSIWIQQTNKHVNVSDIVDKFRDFVHYTYHEENLGVFGRFESVTQVSTPYTYIIDDDIIPGSGFLENALKASKEKNAIISPHGRLLDKKVSKHKPLLEMDMNFSIAFVHKLQK